MRVLVAGGERKRWCLNQAESVRKLHHPLSDSVSATDWPPGAIVKRGHRKFVGLPGRFEGQDHAAHHSEKTYDFSALFICVRDQRADEFWHAARQESATRAAPSGVAPKWVIKGPVGES